jgi:hypothetical protein
MQHSIHPHRHSRSRPARLLAGAALVSGVLVAGCGGSSPSASPPTGSSSSASSSKSTSSTLAFSKCMRANGVPNFPDLRGNRMLIQASGQTLSVDGVSVNAPAFLAARANCEKYIPHGIASPAQAAQQTRKSLQFARCMRSHGVPNFPDPKVTTGTNGNAVADLRGAGLNFQSPAFKAAANDCGGFNPKGP